MAACGLDFGTSNTTLGLVTEGRPALLRLEGDHVTIPSAILFPAGWDAPRRPRGHGGVRRGHAGAG